MSDCKTNMEELKTRFKSDRLVTPEQTKDFYQDWAQTYDQCMCALNYKGPQLAADLLNAHFSGSREEVQVLDVACGTGLAAKLMFDLGFRQFVGVDGSQRMLDQAAQTGLYQDLRLALVGEEPLPAQTGLFDVVVLVGALSAAFIPVSAVRELCNATKPGGFVCMTKGDHPLEGEDQYKKDLERELQLMEEEGLWSFVGIKQTDRYMANPRLSSESHSDMQEARYISGCCYLYKKSS